MIKNHKQDSQSCCLATRGTSAGVFVAAMLFLISGLVCGFADEAIRIGDSMDRVLEVFDTPQGVVKGGGQTILIYDRGMVTLIGGKVVKIEIVSPAQLEENRLETERERAESRKADALARQRRIVDGNAELATRRADVAFGKSTAADRVAFWKSFQGRYPEVSVGAELESAESDLAAANVEKVKAEKERLAKVIAEKEKEEAEVADRLSKSVGSWHLRHNRAELKRVREELTDLKQKLSAL